MRPPFGFAQGRLSIRPFDKLRTGYWRAYSG